MPKFRKKPVVIEAVQFTRDALPLEAVPKWFSGALIDGSMWFQGGAEPYLTVRTLEGEMRANLGDWIIRGVSGELYPCKPDIFAKTYEVADA